MEIPAKQKAENAINRLPHVLRKDAQRSLLRGTYVKNTLGASTGMDEMQSISRPTMTQISFAHTVEHTNGLENT